MSVDRTWPTGENPPGTVDTVRLLLRRRREIFDHLNVLPRPHLLWLYSCTVVAFFFGYPLVLVYYLLKYRRRPADLRFLERLRFHWNRPLSYPAFEGAGYNFLHYLLTSCAQGQPLLDDKLHWFERFRAAGIRTPRVFLVIDRQTRGEEAVRIPGTDIVVKGNRSSRGVGMQAFTFDRATSRFDGVHTGEDIVEMFRNRAHPNSKDRSFLVTERIRHSRANPYGECNQHLRCVTVRRNGAPLLFKALLHVQPDRGRFPSNHARGAWIRDATAGRVEGVPLVHFRTAVEQALQLHREIDIVSMAWDIILADDGPWFLEGNIAHSVYYPEYADFYGVMFDYYRATGFLPVPL